MSNQTTPAEANDSDRPNDQHAVGFSVSLDDGVTRRDAMSVGLAFLLFDFGLINHEHSVVPVRFVRYAPKPCRIVPWPPCHRTARDARSPDTGLM